MVEPTKDERMVLLAEQLDAGEAEAISLALQLGAEFLLIDEQTGRKVAQSYGVRVTGVLGILLQAKKKQLIPLVKPLLQTLTEEVGFRVQPALVKRVLELAGESYGS